MEEKPIRYEKQEVKTLRGLEAKSIEKMEQDGWELVSQDKGKLRATLNFRRPKKPISKKTILLGASAAGVLAAIVIFGAITAEHEGATPTTQERASEEATEAPAPKPTEDANQILTVENNHDLATLLSNSKENTWDFWGEFYKKYKGRTIEFNGNISLLEKDPDFEFTYNALIEAGNYSETSSLGAPFRAIRVVVPFGWKKTNQDDVIIQGTNVHIVARIWDYNEAQSFEIKLVSTSVR